MNRGRRGQGVISKDKIRDTVWGGLKFGRFVLERFSEDRCTLIASALTLTSLLALVPLMAVALAIFSAFPGFTQMVVEVQNFLFKNFVPDSGAVIQSYLLEFVAQAQQLQLFGILFIIAAALLLMATIDNAFNTIWRVQKKRPWIRLFLLYWAVLTLGPILVGFSVGLTSYFASLPVISDAAHQVGGLQKTILPFMLTGTCLTLTYAVVPNCSVPIRHALWGGIIAALLFEVSKRGFALYITTVPTYRLVFGALATVPIFFIWVYLSWNIVLFGAEIAHGLSVYRAHGEAAPNHDVVHALEILLACRKRQKEGLPATPEALGRMLPQMGRAPLDATLKGLQEAGILGALAGGGYALTWDLEDLTLAMVYRKLGWPLPSPENPRLPRKFERVFKEANQTLEALFSIPLARLMDE